MNVSLQLDFCPCPRWLPPPRFAPRLKTEGVQCTAGVSSLTFLRIYCTSYILYLICNWSANGVTLQKAASYCTSQKKKGCCVTSFLVINLRTSHKTIFTEGYKVKCTGFPVIDRPILSFDLLYPVYPAKLCQRIVSSYFQQTFSGNVWLAGNQYESKETFENKFLLFHPPQ